MLGAIALVLGAMPCTAQEYPNRPIRWVIPNPAGGTPDLNARLVANQVAKQLGYNIVMDNRAGGSGIIGMDVVAKAEPDGYTMLYTTVQFATNPTAFKSLPFDVIKDFVPVTNVANGIGMIVVVNPSLPARNLQELVSLAKRVEKKLDYGTPGTGSGQHIGTQLFESRAGVQLHHVPYKGLPPALTALVGGEIQMMIMAPTAALPFVKAGKLRVLAYTGASRWSELPEVPTVMEAGVPDYRFDNFWHGLFAPRNTRAAVIGKMQFEVAKALQVPAVRSGLVAVGYEPIGDKPEEFKKFFQQEIVRWREIARLTKLQPQ